MIVNCESCGTKFRFNTDRIRGSKAKVRCSRCKHVFVVNVSDEEEYMHVDLSDGAPMDEDTLDSSLDDFASPPVRKAKRKISLKVPAAALAILLVSGIAVYWLAGRTSSAPHPEPASQAKTAPADSQQVNITIMDSTQAYFLENSHTGQIFVVEGEVVNESGRPVSFILLEGRLYTKNNQVAQSQRCFSGNPLTKDELIKLNMNDIQNRMMNREGKELINVNIPQSKKIPFMLIFHNLPELDDLSDYSIEVISAKAG